jgi:hypothetical protein
MDAFVGMLSSRKYLVVFPDMTTKLYQSLRELAQDISASAATLSRRLSVNDQVLYVAPVTSFVFYIVKLDEMFTHPVLNTN